MQRESCKINLLILNVNIEYEREHEKNFSVIFNIL